MSSTVQYAGLSKRLYAFAFDYLIILGYIIILGAVTYSLVVVLNLVGQNIAWPDDPLKADLMAFVTLVLPVILYFTLLESSSSQATWGKQKAGLQVTIASGGKLTKRQAFVRSIFKFLPWQIVHTALFHFDGWPFAPTDPTPMVIAGFVLVWVMVALYVMSILISKKHRAPYDWVSGSYVVVTKLGCRE
jgi:uncharacterized RDD family membrane protein YckC